MQSPQHHPALLRHFSRHIGLLIGTVFGGLLGAAIALFGLESVRAQTAPTPDDPFVSPFAGQVLFEPDRSQSPYASAGYPRVIRLTHSGVPYDGRLLATFAFGGDGQPERLPVFQSADEGLTWTRIATVTAATQAGWGLGAPTLFEMPRQVGNVVTGTLLIAGTSWKYDGPPNKYGVPGLPGIYNDFSHQVIEIHQSTDHGQTWSYHGKCQEISGVPNAFGYGIWEPHFQIDASGNLVCYFAWERPGGVPSAKAQVLAHVSSSDGGLTWSTPVSDVVSSNNDDRPGMPVVIRLPNSSYFMAYELCRGGVNANDACLVYAKTSPDGVTWNAGDLGNLIESTDGHRLAHTPFVAWSPAGGANGTMVMSGQALVTGDTGSLTEQEGSGKTLFVNTSLGDGSWSEIPAPLTVAPVGNYNPQFPAAQFGCSGYSSPILPSTTGTSVLMLAGSLVSPDGAQCEIRFGVASLGALPYFAPLANATDAGWSMYGGLWTVKDATLANYALGPGQKAVMGSTGWMTYTVQADMRMMSEGQAGLLFRVSNPQTGADALNGYYLGLETQYSGGTPGGSLVLGQFNNNSWSEINRVSVSGGAKVHAWYHLTVQAVGCAFTVSAQPVGDTGNVTTFASSVSNCRVAGQVGVRSHFTRAAWRNISVVAGGTTSTATTPYLAPFANSNTGWTNYGGAWALQTAAEVYQNTTGGAGEKAVAGQGTWTNYSLQGEARLTSSSGTSPNAGFIVRVSNPAVGADALNGYYVGINSDSDTLVIGRHLNNWTALSSASVLSGVSLNQWYHFFVEVIGCTITATVQPIDSPEQTTASTTDTGCSPTTGQIGVRTFNAPADWRFVEVTPR